MRSYRMRPWTIDDFAVAVDNHMTRISCAENARGLVIRQSDVIDERMLL